VLNVRGIQSSLVDIHNLTVDSDPAPQVIVLTETKLTSKARQRAQVRQALKGYHVYYSNVRHKQSCRAGVLIAVSKAFCELGTITQPKVDVALQGWRMYWRMYW